MNGADSLIPTSTGSVPDGATHSTIDTPTFAFPSLLDETSPFTWFERSDAQAGPADAASMASDRTRLRRRHNIVRGSKVKVTEWGRPG